MLLVSRHSIQQKFNFVKQIGDAYKYSALQGCKSLEIKIQKRTPVTLQLSRQTYKGPPTQEYNS